MNEAVLGGRTALVTGASRGIGLAVARALVGAGARVALLARGADALARAAAELGPTAHAVVCDLGGATATTQALVQVQHLLGDVDILVNNAGSFPLAAVGEMDPEAFLETLALNLGAPFRLLHELLPRMRDRGAGHVVTIGSVADRTAYPGNAAYAATKYGARGVHEVLREETRGSGVRVSLVSPAPVDTALWDAIEPETRSGFPTRAQMLRPQDVAEAVLWVLSRPPGVNVDELRLSHS